jgi:hypothetical protein
MPSLDALCCAAVGRLRCQNRHWIKSSGIPSPAFAAEIGA